VGGPGKHLTIQSWINETEYTGNSVYKDNQLRTSVTEVFLKVTTVQMTGAHKCTDRKKLHKK